MGLNDDSEVSGPKPYHLQQSNFMSRGDGSIDPFILGRDIELRVAYDILSAKYDALVIERAADHEKMQVLREALRQFLDLGLTGEIAKQALAQTEEM